MTTPGTEKSPLLAISISPRSGDIPVPVRPFARTMTNDLRQHTITGITFGKAARHYPRPIGYNSHIGPHGQTRELHTCTLHTDQGATGWSFCGPDEEAYRRFIGRTLTDLFSLEQGTALEAMMLDIALHDLAGNILGQPVWRMLGGSENQIPIYSGGIYFDDLDPEGDDDLGLDALLAACEQDASLGYTHFKLKIGRGFRWMERAPGDARDIAVTRLVRERYPDARLLVDANDGYDPDGFGRYLNAVADCHIYWVEEPFAESIAGLQQLRTKLADISPETLIADGEKRNGPTQDPPGPFGKWPADQIDELLDFCRRDLIDVILPDVGAMGFTAWRQLMPRLIATGKQGSPHAWGETFKSYYAAQIGCAYGHVPIVEGVPGRIDGVDDSGYVIKDGFIRLPDSPGFGMTLESA